MPAPVHNTNTPPASAPETKKFAQPIYANTISWKWLLGGLICFFGLGGVAGAVYFVQSLHMPAKVVKTVENMVNEADQKKAEMLAVNDPTAKTALMADSLKLRGDAANLLNNYRQANSETTNVKVLEKLYDILDSLYKDYGETSTIQGIQRGEQLNKLAGELANALREADSLKYRTRRLELEWDRHSLTGVISRGKDLLKASMSTDPANYDALRYVALACFDQIPIQPYRPADWQLPMPPFDETMDGLLKKLNSRKPDDIEIAKRYAEFLVSLDHIEPDRRKNFIASAGNQLTEATGVSRAAEAKACIDTMVSLNKDDPAAYLARFHFVYFVAQYVPSLSEVVRPKGESGRANEDLETVLKLAPSNGEGLILSSIDALRLARSAEEAGNKELAQTWQKKAEENLRRTIRDNPSDPFGYQYLGDYLLKEEKPLEAVEVWNEGLKKSNHRGDEELIGRLVSVLLGRKMIEEVREKLTQLDRTIAEMRYSRPPQDIIRTRDMQQLLRAQLYLAEANVAASKIDMTMRESRPAEFRRLSGIVQQKKGAAIQEFDELLRNFGKNRNDYIFERQSVYGALLPQALLQAGELRLEWGDWDAAFEYFNRARPFPIAKVREMALLGMSVACQQGNKLDDAAQALKIASDDNPDDLNIRYAYATLLFRSQIASNAVTADRLNDVQKELEIIRGRRSELPQPWVLDIRLIQLGVARANLSNSAQTIIDAMQEAARKFRALESQTFPPDKDGKVKQYSDDPAFVSEMVGVYGSLSERADFDRMLDKLREFPDGEDAYYEARINDCLRREDKNGAIALIDEAVSNPKLSAARKDRFAALLQTLKSGDQDNELALDGFYSQLKASFVESPELLKPKVFFLLADMSIDRGDLEQARQVRDRLKKLEGKNGTYWRYIEVRLMLNEKDPDYARMREIQETIAKYRENWDMTYVLRALIEERFLESNPGDLMVREEIIRAYQQAIRCGNRQANIRQRLVALYKLAGRMDDANEVSLNAARQGILLESRGQLPYPYNQMYTNVQMAIANEDATNADTIARQCIVLATRRMERSELIFTLNMTFGKVFLEAEMFNSAIRHLSETARRGGTYVYPLALCMAKAGNVDEGFHLLLDETDAVPSTMPTLLPAILLLMSQVSPSEEVFQRIDRLMSRIEKGERLTLSGKVEDYKDGEGIPLLTRRGSARKLQSLVIRFPEMTTTLEPSEIQFISPEEWGTNESGQTEQQQ